MLYYLHRVHTTTRVMPTSGLSAPAGESMEKRKNQDAIAAPQKSNDTHVGFKAGLERSCLDLTG